MKICIGIQRRVPVLMSEARRRTCKSDTFSCKTRLSGKDRLMYNGRREREENSYEEENL